jgi:glycosyltransferase involved in cell wall biosynthesis
MRILHVHSGNMFGGVERMLETLAPASAGVTPVQSSFALCFKGQVSDTLRAAGGEVFDLGEVRVRKIDEVRRARRQLRAVLARGWDAAFVHSAWSQAAFGPAVLKAGLPLVRWLHSPAPGPWWLERWSARSRPALVLCNSRYTRDGIGGRMGDVPMSVHYPPAALPVRGPETRADVRAELGTRADAIVIAMASRLESGKGHAPLIAAMAGLNAPAAEAWIIGGVQLAAEQAYLDSLQRQVTDAGIAGRVRFLGQRGDVQRLLRAADVYCQPNRDPDSFGLSFVEALAASLPVVTTRMGAAAEIVDAGCGILVTPGSITELTGALQRLVAAPAERQSMGQAARRRAASFGDLPASMARLAGELTSISESATLSK